MTGTRLDRVRAFFDEERHHRALRHVTSLRAEVVRDLLGSVAGAEVLDVGAGDGSVTIGLLPEAARLTWLDVSPRMLEAARRSIPAELADRVVLVESALESYARPADVVVCVGVLAHVESLHAAMGKLGVLVRTEGRLVLELDDDDAAAGLPSRLAHRLRERSAPHYGYRLNAMSLVLIDTIAGHHGFLRRKTRRYWAAWPLMHRLGIASAFERMTLKVPWLARRGSNVIALYEKVPRVTDLMTEEQRRAWLET